MQDTLSRRALAGEALGRIGQVWVTNVGVVFSFALRLISAAGQSLAEIGSRKGVVRVVKLTLQQVFKTLSRGALDVRL